MPTLYLPLEPQPEIQISHDVADYWAVTHTPSNPDGVGHIVAPYKPGDEIEVPVVIQDPSVGPKMFKERPTKRTVYKTGIVKSISPIQREGLWQWQVEVE